MTRKIKVPSEDAITKGEVPQEPELGQDGSQGQKSENSEGSIDDIVENWEELQDVLEGTSIDDVFEKGWKPLLRTKPNGKQYMVLRLHGRDPGTGKYRDTERGLGLHTSTRWDTLNALFEESHSALPSVIPRDSSLPSITTDSQTTNQTGRSPVLSTKVGRVRPIGPSVEIKLGTLQWFNWVQQDCGYPGSLDDFINDTVDSYFRSHHHLELAVVVQGGQN